MYWTILGLITVALNKAKAQIVTAWWVEGGTAFPNPMSKPYMWDPKPEKKSLLEDLLDKPLLLRA